jgi:hypothetical protein
MRQQKLDFDSSYSIAGYYTRRNVGGSVVSRAELVSFAQEVIGI